MFAYVLLVPNKFCVVLKKFQMDLAVVQKENTWSKDEQPFFKALSGSSIPGPSSAPPEAAPSTAAPVPSFVFASSSLGLWSALLLCWRCLPGSAEALSLYQTCFYRCTLDDISKWKKYNREWDILTSKNIQNFLLYFIP